MTSAERIRRVFEGRDTDVVPVMHIGFSSEVAARVLGREAYIGGGAQQYREACALWAGPKAHAAFVRQSLADAIEIGLTLHHDVVRIGYWRLPRMPAERLDEYTFAYIDETRGGPRRVVRRYVPESEQFEPVGESVEQSLEEAVEAAEASARREIVPEKHFASFLEARAILGDHPIRVSAAALGIPFTAPWLEATIAEPELVERLLDAQVRRGLNELRALHALGGMMAFGGGDMASAQGPLYSPRTFRALMLPRLQTLTAECERLGMKYLFNSDGNLWPVADMIFGEGGVHGYYEIDADAGMALPKLRERYPDLVLLGNISSGLVHTGTPEQVRKATLECLELAKQKGRIVVGCSNAVVPGTPPANLEAMLGTIDRCR